MYGFIYLTTNNVNGKKYIGKRSYIHGGWENYLGSGIVLRKAIEKHGKENFSREIIDEAETPEELSFKEQYWIREYNAIKSTDFYNIALGGIGGNTYAGKTEQEMEEIRIKLRQPTRYKGSPGEKNGMFGKHHKDETKKKIGDANRGRIVTDEHKEKIKEALKGLDRNVFKTSAKKIEVTLPNGEVKIFDSKKECCEDLNMSKPSVNSIIKSGLPFMTKFKHLKHLEGTKIKEIGD